MPLASKVELDSTDWRLLHELQDNARLTYTELGRRVGLTQPAVAERVRRLEEAGVITGYHAVLDPRALGRPLLAFVRVNLARADRSAALGACVRDWSEVLECHRITGEDCYIMKVALTSVEHLEAFINRVTQYGQPVTSLVLSSPASRRALGPAAAAPADAAQLAGSRGA
jgi:Lrp/AsnC family leucine-responsive transcriptional regulator